MTTIYREDPPDKGVRVLIDHDAVANQLKADPGNWYRIAETPYAQIATNINCGALAAYRPAKSFQARSRLNKETGIWTVWARYVGEVAE